MDITITTKLTAEDLAACAELYESVFPENERRPTEEWKRLATEEGTFKIYPFFHAKGVFCGFISFWEFNDFTYVEHFAILDSHRGKNIGSMVFGIFLSLYQAQAIPVVLEVEPPTDELTRSRIRFYERAGMHLLPCDYVQPPYAPHLQPLPLRLMCSKCHISEEKVNHFVECIHKNVYDV